MVPLTVVEMNSGPTVTPFQLLTALSVAGRDLTIAVLAVIPLDPHTLPWSDGRPRLEPIA